MTEPHSYPRNSLSDLGKAAIDRFCCQYLQLEAHLDYPDGQLLKTPEAQDAIFGRIFADCPPSSKSARFQLRVLKELVKRIQDGISENEADDFVCQIKEGHRSGQRYGTDIQARTNMVMVGGFGQDNGPPGGAHV